MKSIIAMLMSIGLALSAFAAEEEDDPSRFSPFLKVGIVGGGMNSADATVYDSQTPDGRQGTFEFSGSVTLLLSGGMYYNTAKYSYGLELEWQAQQFDIDAAPEPYDTFSDIQGDAYALNGIIGMNAKPGYRPYVFAGLTYNEVSLYETPGYLFYEEGVHTDDDVFGYQLGIGVRFFAPEPASTKLNMDIGVRYFQTSDLTFRTDVYSIEMENSGYLIHVGFTYNPFD